MGKLARDPFILLLVFIPAGLLAELLHWSPLVVFILSAVAIVPLARWIGTATEELATYVGPGIGGLLNATFGNATELIIAIFALRAGLVDVVKASITGSILGNLLFVLGFALFFGGLRREKQSFNATASGIGATQMTLAVIGLFIPAALYYTLTTPQPATRSFILEEFSLLVSGLLIAAYASGLIFSLRTHKHLYMSSMEDEGEIELSTRWSKQRSIGVLLVATIGVAVMSELLVSSLEVATKKLGWSDIFVGIVVIPIIGNAAEHVTAVTVAIKNKMDLAIGIAVGSSTQVALLLAPLLVFISLLFNPHMNLLLTPFELVAVGLAVLIANLITLDGESNWYEGALLLTVYGILGVAFYLYR
jgi:Ca2+:H+ antiporter